MDRRKIAEKLVSWLVPGAQLVMPAYEEVEGSGDVVTCGTGPETCNAWRWDNPNWHRNRASNELAIADYLEIHGA